VLPWPSTVDVENRRRQSKKQPDTFVVQCPPSRPNTVAIPFGCEGSVMSEVSVREPTADRTEAPARRLGGNLPRETRWTASVEWSMVLMALDHTRDFLSDARFNPLDLTRTDPARSSRAG